jgi:hypothetical protein
MVINLSSWSSCLLMESVHVKINKHGGPLPSKFFHVLSLQVACFYSQDIHRYVGILSHVLEYG